MISVDKIEKTLEWLEECYDRSKNADIEESKIYSKIAILELSGWVEESMDDIIWNLADKKLDSNKAKKRLKKTISNVNSFTYEKHFSEMLRKAIGVINKEAIEKKIRDRTDGTLIKFENALKKLYSERNPLAHTFSQGKQEYIDSPSMVKKYYEDICFGLRVFEEEIAKSQGV